MKEKPDNTIVLGENQDIFDYYLEEKAIDSGPRSIHNYETAIKSFKEYMDSRGYTIDDIGRREAKQYISWMMNEKGLEKNTALKYAESIDRIATFYNQVGYFEWNPIHLALEGYSRNSSGSTKRELTVEELGRAITEIADSHPVLFVALVILAKTGARRSEVSNIDLRDINIDHPVSEKLPEPRAEIKSTPDTMYVPGDIEEGKEYNSEVRVAGNKRKKPTHYPIDDELKSTLIWWFGIMPETEDPGKPLLRNIGRNIGRRVAPGTLYQWIRTWAKDNGLHDGKGGINVDVHWFRHFFTTKMRRSVDNSDLKGNTEPKYYVKGLRGDTGDDVIDLYTHDWGENRWKRTAYLENIYKIIE
jgi:integrase